VEDAATWEQLTELGCDSAQGYYLARPMAAPLFQAWIDQYVATPAAPIVREALTRGGPAPVRR
jgi:predicted signal transduction protein with EAL and GGDEF domain